ncbi:MAG: hypothetical protein UU01_C0020G0009 [Parcubacteria group bacterium GW2011_GWA2_40_37]|nr:MAG: hypothetical protein UU01_C0020G0009 [Parcubacteria group bacterium GW2011_GWA2_40_37]
MHNHDGKGNNNMMWMMVICCAVPLLLLIFVGGTGGRALGASSWVIFGGVAVMVIAHFFMGHGCCH